MESLGLAMVRKLIYSDVTEHWFLQVLGLRKMVHVDG